MQSPEEIAAANARAEQALQTQLQLATQQQAHAMELNLRNTYTSYMQMAHASLIETKRNLPVGERSITAEEIVNFANSLKAAADAAMNNS